MLSTLVVCLLVMGASAFQPPNPHQMKNLATPIKSDNKPCCSPNSFTYKATATSTSLDHNGDLLLELTHIEGAYDAITEQYSLKLFENFFNSTERHIRIIEDFKKGESYLILKDEDEELCFVSETEGAFQKDCVPDDAVYLGEASVGDRGLDVDSWYYASEDQSTHFTKSVEVGMCVPVSSFSREFDLDTEKEIEIVNIDLFDFNLGICDPDEHFEPPSSCEEGRALAEPNAKMLKFQARRRKGFFPL